MVSSPTAIVAFLALVVPRLIFVLVAFLLAPPISSDRPFDLYEYYFRHIRWVAWLFSISLVGFGLSRAILGAEEPLNPH